MKTTTAQKALEALKQVAQALAWSAHGECRGYHDKLPAAGFALELAKATIAEIEQEIAQPVEPATRHIHEHAATLLIDHFLCRELGCKDAPGVTLEKQGERESESHSWAFWILESDTTSYLHEDGRIEWCGTAWEPDEEQKDLHFFLLDVFKSLDDTLEFHDWENGDGEPIGAALRDAVHRLKELTS